MSRPLLVGEGGFGLREEAVRREWVRRLVGVGKGRIGSVVCQWSCGWAVVVVGRGMVLGLEQPRRLVERRGTAMLHSVLLSPGHSPDLADQVCQPVIVIVPAPLSSARWGRRCAQEWEASWRSCCVCCFDSPCVFLSYGCVVANICHGRHAKWQPGKYVAY